MNRIFSYMDSMGCNGSKFLTDPRSHNEPNEQECIEKIFDYMTSDSDLTESCVLAISEKMKQISLLELKTSFEMIKERHDKVKKSNAVDLFLIAVTDDHGNITYNRFKKFIKEMRLRPEHYRDLLERLKKIRLHKGCGHSTLRGGRTRMEPIYIGDVGTKEMVLEDSTEKEV